jgi:hypothetical protein
VILDGKVESTQSVGEIYDTLEYLKKYRSDDGFSSALIHDKENASNLDVEPTFCK